MAFVTTCSGTKFGAKKPKVDHKRSLVWDWKQHSIIKGSEVNAKKLHGSYRIHDSCWLSLPWKGAPFIGELLPRDQRNASCIFKVPLRGRFVFHPINCPSKTCRGNPTGDHS